VEFREFGRTGFRVSCVGFGGAAISGEGGGYGFGEISESDAIDLVKRAFDLGINLFDTAPIYGFGESERRLGKALKSIRDKVWVISKSGVSWHPNRRVNMTNDPKVTLQMLEQSLRDLNTDYIDLYMIHWPDQQVDIRRPMEILAQAQHEKKIRFLGLSNTNPGDYERASQIARIEVLQSEYNAFTRYPEEELWPLVKAHRLGFMSWGTLDKGILTGRVSDEKRKFDPSDARSHAPWWKSQDRSWKFRVVEKLRPILDEFEMTPLEACIGYVLAHREVSSALCGARTAAQLEGIVAAASKTMPTELVNEIRSLVDQYRTV
jgi:myo-inositol catabolism protein IolS